MKYLFAVIIYFFGLATSVTLSPYMSLKGAGWLFGFCSLGGMTCLAIYAFYLRATNEKNFSILKASESMLTMGSICIVCGIAVSYFSLKSNSQSADGNIDLLPYILPLVEGIMNIGLGAFLCVFLRISEDAFFGENTDETRSFGGSYGYGNTTANVNANINYDTSIIEDFLSRLEGTLENAKTSSENINDMATSLVTVIRGLDTIIRSIDTNSKELNVAVKKYQESVLNATKTTDDVKVLISSLSELMSDINIFFNAKK